MRVLITSFVAAGAVWLTSACSDGPTTPVQFDDVPAPPAGGTYGCPQAFTPTTADQSADATAADHDGDFLVCELDVISEGGSDVVRTYVDNNVPNRVGTCPPSFQMGAVKFGDADDRNKNGRVCQATRPNGNSVIVDDHFDANPNNTAGK